MPSHYGKMGKGGMKKPGMKKKPAMGMAKKKPGMKKMQGRKR
tara:strand:+ start:772 stop:897 length:126 start_codon:yes stop_codon:yes gene_type:complete